MTVETDRGKVKHSYNYYIQNIMYIATCQSLNGHRSSRVSISAVRHATLQVKLGDNSANAGRLQAKKTLSRAKQAADNPDRTDRASILSGTSIPRSDETRCGRSYASLWSPFLGRQAGMATTEEAQ